MKENGRNNREVFYWDLQDERRFIYDGMDIIEERDGSNNLIAFYTRTGNIGEVLSRTTPSNTVYYHYDGNGNVVSLTDVSENVVATYEYDAYGNLQASGGAEVNNNPFRFSTKYFDVTAGFYDYGFRFYDSVTGRWLSRDPIQEEGGINLYGFVGNGPVNAWDEYGYKDRSGWAAGQIVNMSKKQNAYGLFDTGEKGNRVVWIVTVPPGYRTNPDIADIDYILTNDPEIPWYHLMPHLGWKFKGLLACRIWDDEDGNTWVQYKGARPVYKKKREGIHGWADEKFGKLAPGEHIDPKSGLPSKMVGTPASPVKSMSVESAKKLGWIYPNPK